MKQKLYEIQYCVVIEPKPYGIVEKASFMTRSSPSSTLCSRKCRMEKWMGKNRFLIVLLIRSSIVYSTDAVNRAWMSKSQFFI